MDLYLTVFYYALCVSIWLMVIYYILVIGKKITDEDRSIGYHMVSGTVTLIFMLFHIFYEFDDINDLQEIGNIKSNEQRQINKVLQTNTRSFCNVCVRIHLADSVLAQQQLIFNKQVEYCEDLTKFSERYEREHCENKLYDKHIEPYKKKKQLLLRLPYKNYCKNCRSYDDQREGIKCFIKKQLRFVND